MLFHSIPFPFHSIHSIPFHYLISSSAPGIWYRWLHREWFQNQVTDLYCNPQPTLSHPAVVLPVVLSALPVAALVKYISFVFIQKCFQMTNTEFGLMVSRHFPWLDTQALWNGPAIYPAFPPIKLEPSCPIVKCPSTKLHGVVSPPGISAWAMVRILFIPYMNLQKPLGLARLIKPSPASYCYTIKEMGRPVSSIIRLHSEQSRPFQRVKNSPFGQGRDKIHRWIPLLSNNGAWSAMIL